MSTKTMDEITQSMGQKTTEELLAIWGKNDRKEWSDDAFEAIRQVLTERNVSILAQPPPYAEKKAPERIVTYSVGGHVVHTGKFHEKATGLDIFISVILPGWGIIVGLLALCKREKKRAITMIVIGACALLIWILYGQF
jgi:hypothetical protein